MFIKLKQKDIVAVDFDIAATQEYQLKIYLIDHGEEKTRILILNPGRRL